MPLRLLLTTTMGLMSPGTGDKRASWAHVQGLLSPIKTRVIIFRRWDVRRKKWLCAALGNYVFLKRQNEYLRGGGKLKKKGLKWDHALTLSRVALITRPEWCYILQRRLLFEQHNSSWMIYLLSPPIFYVISERQYWQISGCKGSFV